MIDMNKIRAHTILFTEDCPLDCRYCQLKLEEGYHKCPTESYDTIFELTQKYREEDLKDGVETQFTFTGGEPFLYWDWIKQIIEFYGNSCTYHFNTCGYCFTEDILEFLSHYIVFFTLSIDGGEKLTNYLRPVRGTKYHTGYYKKIKEITPILMYYFPNVDCKIIVNNRTVDLLYETYLNMEAIGFQRINFILDFNARPQVKGTKKEIQRVWEESDTKILEEQFELLLKEFLLRFSLNKTFARVSNIDKVIQYLLLKPDSYSPDNLSCKVFNGRTLKTLYGEEPVKQEAGCFSQFFQTLDEAKDALLKEYEKCNGKCPLDPTCNAFFYCANNNCPISSYECTKTWFGSDTLECILVKISYKTALQLLSIANEICPDSSTYQLFLNTFNYEGKEEYINGNLLSV